MSRADPPSSPVSPDSPLDTDEDDVDNKDDSKDDSKDQNVLSIIGAGTYMGRIPVGTYSQVQASSSSATLSVSAPPSPPFQRRHKPSYRQRTQSLSEESSQTSLSTSTSSSRAVVSLSQSMSNLTLTDFENSEHHLPEMIPEDVLVRILTELNDRITKLANVKSYDELAKKWMETRRQQFQLDALGRISPNDINLEYEQALFTLGQVRLKFIQMQLIQDDHNQSTTSYTYTAQFSRLYEIIYGVRTLLFTKTRLDELADANKHYEMGQFSDYVDPSYFNYLRPTNLLPFQRFLMNVLRQAAIRRYRKRWQHFRHNGIQSRTVCLYEQVYTPDGHPTHAWEKRTSIERFIHTLTSQDTNFNQWDDLTRVRGMMGAVKEYLKTSEDAGLPLLQRQRHMFAFRNGIYDAEKKRFFTYNHPLPSSVVCSKYFDQKFPVELNTFSDAKDIMTQLPTPPLDRIFNEHKIPLNAQFVILALFGRHLHDMNKLDRWQVALFFIGIPGTGKSTLANFFRQLFDHEDVGVMSSDMEKQFGLSALADKFLNICTEVSEKFNLTHTMLQSMIDGEPVSFARKYDDPAEMDWLAHTLLFANVVPPHWSEFGGNLLRRFVVVMFNDQIKNVETDLDRQLMEYLPQILHKCNLCYHKLAEEWKNLSFWTKAPDYFTKTKEQLGLMVSPIQSFIQVSGYVEVTTNFNDIVPTNEFMTALNKFCQERGFLLKRWTTQLCLPTFRRFGLQETGNVLHNIRFTPEYLNRNSMPLSRSASVPAITDHDDM
jgi:hypothetical protein